MYQENKRDPEYLRFYSQSLSSMSKLSENSPYV